MIFRYAYEGFEQPPGPLSQSSLDMYYNSLFEFVSLSSSEQLKSLVEAITSYPENGSRIKRLEITQFARGRKDRKRFQTLLPTLSRLEELKIGHKGRFILRAIQLAPVDDSILPNLRTIKLAGELLEFGDGLASWTSRLGSLRRLELVDWKGSRHQRNVVGTPATSVDEISIDNRGESGDGFDMNPLDLLEHFPSASFSDTRLTFSSITSWADIESFLAAVNPRTKALFLDANTHSSLLDDPNYAPLDSYLTNLPQLEHLKLVSPLFSDRIHLTLASLRNLRTLIIEGEAPNSNFVSILQGPNRLPRLVSISFSLYPNFSGGRVDSTNSSELAFVGDFDGLPDWTLPFADQSYYLEGALGMKAILKAAVEAQVTLKGNFVGSLNHAWRFVIEVHNRGVARAYLQRDLRVLRQARSFAESNFPSFVPQTTLEVDDSEKEDWELYEVEWDEEERNGLYDCHVLSLRNRG